MLAFHHTRKVLQQYSRTLQKGLYTIHKSQSYVSLDEHVRMLLYMNPLPNFRTKNIYEIPVGLFTEPVTHIPLIEDEKLGVYMKMIVWNPNGEIGVHSHKNIQCYFQAMYPDLIQTIWRDHKYPHNVHVRTNVYSYISDEIGSHSMKYENEYFTNVSFHLYIHNDFDPYSTTRTSTSHSTRFEMSNEHSCMNSDPDLYWYANEYERD